ncbi:MAG TPA: bifunctional 5,6,7,8-tetrahydromethanopterin hydro-lyase/3-hexulose-6-phosphate synthase [Candidatus Bathyarchaeia archaeon]|nr:bifunctional 5,6,7,8-tetrahydromethanopterin hydro-lyase/3-hexulose-6-phosphate synthase [Candidatus Bathyarchaeia archaeon]
MSESSGRKPTSRGDFVRQLTAGMNKEMESKKTRKPTIAGTAKIMHIHRDTLYEWMREFGVEFEDALKREAEPPAFEKQKEKFTYLIGEALVGEGNEVAHVDLLIGDKNGPVGEAFAQGMSNLSVGHTPLLAVIRPNLPPKPHTLLVPKVTVKNLEQAGKIFGPAQAAVAKAVADSVEENIIPREKADDWVIVCSVFVHPEAKDYRQIYQYNYGATKLALQRALVSYPSLDKIFYDKDRAKHPIMGFKVPRLWRPPYLQIALDNPNIERAKEVVLQVPESDRVILEVGTPLLKKYGAKAVRELRENAQDVFIVADLKTLDVGKVEVDLAFEETADAAVAAGLAAPEILDGFIYEAKRLGIYAFVDMMGVADPVQKLRSLKQLPDVVILHRPIDVEKAGVHHRMEMIKELRQAFPHERLLIAIAGGIIPETAKEALEKGADIVIAGRYITQSKDVKRAVRDFLQVTPEMREDIDLYRVHVE